MGTLSNMRWNHKGPRGGVSKLLKRPLRKVVRRLAGGIEVLECGHEQLEVHDLMGPTNAVRRRCRACPDQAPKQIKFHTVERLEKGVWLFVCALTPERARREMAGWDRRGQRVRRLGARGQVLEERGR